MKGLYLLVNFSAVIIPFIYSFHPRIRFDRTFKAFFMGSVPVAIVFIIWDILFTRMGIWHFNPDYVIGIYIFNLPLEEWLFFICIPFACVFTYYCLDKFFRLNWNPRFETLFCLVFAGALLATGIIFSDRLYTSVTFISTALVCLFLKFGMRVKWLGKAVTVYGILLIPFFMVNGVLTGLGPEAPVVLYDNSQNLGIRLFTIPVEDAVYGFTLFVLNVWLYQRFASPSHTFTRASQTGL